MGYDDFVRRGQLIVPFGVGAMIDFPEDTLMTAALDYWPIETAPLETKGDIRDAVEILDERLQRRLSAVLRGKKIKFFCEPSEGRRRKDPKANHLAPMPFVRFPTWLTCPRCRRLKEYRLSDSRTPKCDSMARHQSHSTGKLCGELKEWQRPYMQPVRFILACEKGHIDNFPWRKWAHYGDHCPEQDAPMFLISTGASGLRGTQVISKCKCGGGNGKQRSMEGCFSTERIQKLIGDHKCTGRSPWLGFENQWQQCSDGEMQTVQRGSSGVHFSHTMSSILIPPYSRAIREYLGKGSVWEEIFEICEDEVNVFGEERRLSESGKKQLARKAKRKGFEEKAFEETVLNKYNESNAEIHVADETEEKYRFREYQAFIGSRPSTQDRELFDINPVDLDDYEPWMAKFFSRVVKVEQLKETKVYTGFSRITPLSPRHPDEAPIANKVVDWLPAVEVRGEGIFFQFNDTTLKDWERLRTQRGLAARLETSIKQRIANGQPNLTRREGKVTEQFLLAHSFSHALIKQLAFECGYDASSLKERLFVSSGDEDTMCSVLIYTASGDSEGSLGGLVDRARPKFLEATLKSAIVESAFCSNDPICMDTGIGASNKDNIVACHACNMLPETSCEHSNYLLDRSALVGEFEEPQLGYFQELLGFDTEV